MAETIHTNPGFLAERVELAGCTAIDIGCGAGGLVRWMRDQGAQVTGVECGEVMRARATDADPDHADSYVDAVGQDLPFDDASADLITFFASLHHVPAEHMADALAEAHRVLRPGGIAYVTEPIADGPSFQVGRLLDDETVVRAQAQDALANAEALGFEIMETSTYLTEHPYTDFEEWEHVSVGIDPTRSAELARQRDAVSAAFYEHGEQRGDYWVFAQPFKLVMLRKPS